MSQISMWVFALNRCLSATEEQELSSELRSSLSDWNSHGALLSADPEIYAGRFVLIRTEHEPADISGCAQDTLRRLVRNAAQAIASDIASDSDIFYKSADNQIVCCSRGEFIDRRNAGIISESTIVLNPAVRTIAEYESQFELPAAESWHWNI